MNTKENVTNEVQKIASDNQDVAKRVVDFVHKDFRKRLVDTERSGESSKRAVQQVLEGVEAGLIARGHQIGDIVLMVADATIDITSDVASQTIGVFTSYAEDARRLFNKAIEKSAGPMEAVEIKAKVEMENAYSAFREKIDIEKSKLIDVTEGIKEHAEDQLQALNDTTRSKLHETVESAKSQIQTLEKDTEKTSRELLQDDRKHVSEWLARLKNKGNH